MKAKQLSLKTLNHNIYHLRESTFQTIWRAIKNKKILRTLSLLSAIFLISNLTLVGLNMSYGDKIEINQSEVERNLQTLNQFQQLVEQKEEVHFASNLFQKKSFANYDEVVPFIAFIENLFSAIDPKAEVTIRSQESQIFMDHYADYEIGVKVDGNVEALYKVLDVINDSRFITNLLRFSLDYKPVGEQQLNQMKIAQFSIRLFLR